MPRGCTPGEFNVLLDIRVLLFSCKIRLLIEINATIDIENTTIAVCRDLKIFLDIDVCAGAIHEYRVDTIYISDQYIYILYVHVGRCN